MKQIVWVWGKQWIFLIRCVGLQLSIAADVLTPHDVNHTSVYRSVESSVLQNRRIYLWRISFYFRDASKIMKIETRIADDYLRVFHVVVWPVGFSADKPNVLTKFRLFSLLYLFWKNENMIAQLHAVCVPVYPSYQLLKASTNLYETWNIYNGNWANLSDDFINPSDQSVCLYVYPPIVARQRLGKNFTATTNTQATIE
jgi:hypothetical protein